MWEWIVCGILALFGIGGTAYGVDQHNKRKREQVEAELNGQIEALSGDLSATRAELAKKEAQLRDLSVQFRW